MKNTKPFKSVGWSSQHGGKFNHTENEVWLKLSDFGCFTSTRGIHQLNNESALMLINKFHSLCNKLMRTMKPVYLTIGFPGDLNHVEAVGHDDTTKLGIVTDLKIQDQAIWAQVVLSDRGVEILTQNHYMHFTPFWKLKHHERNTFYPCELLAIGATSRPVIPGNPIPNPGPEAKLPSLKTKSLINPQSPSSILAKTPQRSAFLQLVLDHMRSSGQDFPSSWNTMKRLHPSLYY